MQVPAFYIPSLGDGSFRSSSPHRPGYGIIQLGGSFPHADRGLAVGRPEGRGSEGTGAQKARPAKPRRQVIALVNFIIFIVERSEIILKFLGGYKAQMERERARAMLVEQVNIRKI